MTNRVLRNGARHVCLETQNTNTPAVHAYRAMGFDIVGLDRTLYDGDAAGETALYLAKPLVAHD
ncbi:ribosomal protein S18 acetylase RimI-like enzyme [Prauserella isguenensis]|uniref:Ribosomal protein S18 acetylase RimI-like enzyme n=1 Tax=Prauserella isguenensis TaxID=1470180 RepID=A0A839RVQ3_9PSEU|nr:ribosomal protein S18 acetylase RimI-like enzyme [Prauserella isguenensis]